MQGDINLLKEMKVIRKGGKEAELPDNVSGANGQEEIAAKFKSVYEELYNSANAEHKMGVMKQKLESLITPQSVMEDEKVTGKSVKKAASVLKQKKTDVTGSYTSETLRNLPDAVFELLAAVYRSWLTHGTITPSISGL